MKLSTPEWLDKVEYPFDNKTIQLQSGTMHYVDEGEGDPILFVHGTPTWSFLYREFIRDFSKTNRAIAIDHLGFGLSEKPENFFGRPQDHTKNLSEFIQKKDLRNITLVVHDFGGPIGLAAAIKQPKRIDKIVIFNTWLWETESYKEVKNIDKVVRSFLGRFLYIWMNFSPRVLLKKGFSDQSVLSGLIHQHYLNPFSDRASRWSLYRLAGALMGSSDWYQSLWEKLEALEEKPWLALWGMKDKFLTPDFLHKWEQRLPDIETKKIPSGHFVQEEKPDESIKHIRNFLES